MNEKGKYIAILIVVNFFLALYLCQIVSFRTRSTERAKAIEAGVGYWEVDQSSGESHFKYGKKPQKDF